MAFYGTEFIYNGIPSLNYGLLISKIDSSGVEQNDLGSQISPITKKILRNPVEFLYGVEQTPVLEFDLEFTSQYPLSAIDRSIISAWLFGQQSRGVLQIMQPDLQNIYFKCLMVSSTVNYVGNESVGFKAHVVCDSPFAWGFPKVTTETGLSGITNKTISIYNNSANSYYTYPIVSFTMTALGGSFSITNTTDNSRNFLFTGLAANEIITVDCDKQIITTNNSLKRISNFNLNWLRLIRGANSIILVGAISTYTITFSPAHKVGG